MFRLLTSSCCSGAWHKGFNNAQPPTSNLLQAVRFYQGDTGCPVPPAHVGTRKFRAPALARRWIKAPTRLAVSAPLCALWSSKRSLTPPPQDVERIGIGGVTGQVIGNLLAHVVDGDGEIASAEGERIIDDGTDLCFGCNLCIS